MSDTDPTSRRRFMRRGTRADGLVLLAVLLATAVGYTLVRFVALANESVPMSHHWTDELEADSAYLAGASPRRVPEGLSGLDSMVWVVYELRDERRRAAGNAFSDSSIAHTVCGSDCSPLEVDSTRVVSYRGRVVRDVLARAELAAEREARDSASRSRAWTQAKAMGFAFSDLLLVIAGGVLIALILKYAPMEEAARRR